MRNMFSDLEEKNRTWGDGVYRGHLVILAIERGRELETRIKELEEKLTASEVRAAALKSHLKEYSAYAENSGWRNLSEEIEKRISTPPNRVERMLAAADRLAEAARAFEFSNGTAKSLIEALLDYESARDGE